MILWSRPAWVGNRATPFVHVAWMGLSALRTIIGGAPLSDLDARRRELKRSVAVAVCWMRVKSWCSLS